MADDAAVANDEFTAFFNGLTAANKQALGEDVINFFAGVPLSQRPFPEDMNLRIGIVGYNINDARHLRKIIKPLANGIIIYPASRSQPKNC